MNRIKRHAEYRLSRELVNENPPRQYVVGGKVIKLSQAEIQAEHSRRVEHNTAVRKDVAAEVRQRTSAQADNEDNANKIMGGGPKVWSPSIQESTLPAPFCARFSERAKNKWAMVAVFLPIVVIIILALLADA